MSLHPLLGAGLSDQLLSAEEMYMYIIITVNDSIDNTTLLKEAYLACPVYIDDI